MPPPIPPKHGGYARAARRTGDVVSAYREIGLSAVTSTRSTTGRTAREQPLQPERLPTVLRVQRHRAKGSREFAPALSPTTTSLAWWR